MRSLSLLAVVACACSFFAACALGQKKIPARYTYRSGFVASADGKTFRPLLDLLAAAEKAKPACKAINRNMATKAQYVVERADTGIKVRITECESPASGNCERLTSCLTTRPVAWLARASGRTPELAGTIYTDWLGRCGGTIAVNFYYGPQTQLPLEKVGCAEPAHDRVDTAYEMFLAPRPEYVDGGLFTSEPQAAGPVIELLLRKWNAVSFGTTTADLLPPL